MILKMYRELTTLEKILSPVVIAMVMVFMFSPVWMGCLSTAESAPAKPAIRPSDNCGEQRILYDGNRDELNELLDRGFCLDQNRTNEWVVLKRCEDGKPVPCERRREVIE